MTEKSRIPVWFWIVTTILLVWNLMGVGSFFQHITVSEEALQALPTNERELYGQYPDWAKIAFALAVFGGAIGCIALLLRRKWARPVLVISLIAVIIQMFHSLFIAKAMDVYGPGSVVMPILVILISIFLVWFANYSFKKGWLR